MKKTTWKEFRDILPPELIEKENLSDFHIVLKNKSQIYGFHCHSEAKIKSLNLDWIHLDEACELSEKIYHQFLARLRGKVGPHKIWLTGNPEGHNWIYQLFVEPTLPKPGHAYFHGQSTDPTFLPEGYVQSLYDSYDTETAKRLIEGSWEVFQDQVFPMFTRDMHVLEWEPDQIPRHWARFRGLDHGFNDPTACLWVAKDPDDNLYVYNEYYQRRTIIEANCQAIIEMSGDEQYVYTVMDPTSNKTESGTGRRIWDLYREHGLVVVGGFNNLHSGISRMRELFEPRPGRVHPTDKRKRTAPKLYILAHCRNTIQEITSHRFEKDVDHSISRLRRERPIDRNNHCIDCLRYVVMHNPQSADIIRGGTMIDWMEHLRGKRDEQNEPYAAVIGNEQVMRR